jgi:tRNA-splicing ligase RtcB
MPIGGVLATKNTIIPNAVGLDIGCGMCSLKTPIKDIEIPELKQYMGEIRKSIPVGFAHQAEAQDPFLMPSVEEEELVPIVGREFNSATRQLGTLGGGEMIASYLQ